MVASHSYGWYIGREKMRAFRYATTEMTEITEMLRMVQVKDFRPFRSFRGTKKSISLSIIKSHGNNRNNGNAPRNRSKNFRPFRYFRGTKNSLPACIKMSHRNNRNNGKGALKALVGTTSLVIRHSSLVISHSSLLSTLLSFIFTLYSLLSPLIPLRGITGGLLSHPHPREAPRGTVLFAHAQAEVIDCLSDGT